MPFNHIFTAAEVPAGPREVRTGEVASTYNPDTWQTSGPTLAPEKPQWLRIQRQPVDIVLM